MKKIRILIVILAAFLPAACSFGPVKERYSLSLPAAPPGWEEILGAPSWRIEWVDRDGVWARREISPGQSAPEISPPEEWTSPVLAWPYWPDKRLEAGVMRNAGGLIPWDVSGGKIRLTWRGGVDAFLWRSLAVSAQEGEEKRLPWFFDWPRFRALLESGGIKEEVKADPWVVDWPLFAQKTVESGFYSSRLKARTVKDVFPDELENSAGPWFSSSPFAAPLTPGEEGRLKIPAFEDGGAWISSRGLLRVSHDAWAFFPWGQGD